jgi:hypothetical protein
VNPGTNGQSDLTGASGGRAGFRDSPQSVTMPNDEVGRLAWLHGPRRVPGPRPEDHNAISVVRTASAAPAAVILDLPASACLATGCEGFGSQPARAGRQPGRGNALHATPASCPERGQLAANRTPAGLMPRQPQWSRVGQPAPCPGARALRRRPAAQPAVTRLVGPDTARQDPPLIMHRWLCRGARGEDEPG